MREWIYLFYNYYFIKDRNTYFLFIIKIIDIQEKFHTGDESNFVNRIRRLTQPIFILLFIYYLFPIRFVFQFV